MGTNERIERERAAKRVLIMDAARELFLQRGYDAVTLRQIAERIEHSTTAIYVHFADKFDLFQQIVHEDFRRFDLALTVHASVSDPVERLRRIGRAYVEFALTMPRSYEMMFMREHSVALASVHTADEQVPGRAAFEALLTTCIELVAHGLTRPRLTDPMSVAQAVWSTVHGLVALRLRLPEPLMPWRPVDEVVDVLMTMICEGILRAPA